MITESHAHGGLARFRAHAVIAALLLWPALAAADPVIRETRPLSGPVNAIQVNGPIDVTLSQGTTDGVTLEGDAKALAGVRLDAADGELRIGWEPVSSFMRWTTAAPLRASLTLPTLRKLVLKGSGGASLSAFDLKGSDLQLEIQGSGDIRAKSLQANALRASIRGSGDMRLGGQVATQEISIAGSGDYLAGEMQSRSTVLSIRGSGDASVWATDTLNVDIAGSGDVTYRGQPQIKKTIRGSGEVTPQR